MNIVDRIIVDEIIARTVEIQKLDVDIRVDFENYGIAIDDYARYFESFDNMLEYLNEIVDSEEAPTIPDLKFE